MKKFLSLVLALIMTMSLVTISAGATEYRDLTDKEEIQYAEAVAVLNRIGVITGYEDGSFRPETELTRGAAAKIIVSLMIGPDAASALPNNASPYPDVPAGHTFAGVIGYCKTAGYISGYGDGTFKPANPLTGYAFAKMLLGAVGYKSSIEGFVDTGWTMNVARIGNVAGLFDRLDFDGAAAVTRDEACQLALNTLKATMVDYGGSNTVVSSTGEVLTVQGSKAQYVTSNNRDINANINRRVISAQNNELTLEFGEEHFKDLRLEHDKYDPAYDVYGHPSNEWSYKKVTIGTFKLPADFTYTDQIVHREATNASKEKALGLRGYDTWSRDHRNNWANWSTASSGIDNFDSPFADETQVHVNGWRARVNGDGRLITDVAARNTTARPADALTLSEIADLTDNGVTVEVYVCPVDADFITDVVVTRTQLMEVDRVASDYVRLADIEPDSRDPWKAPNLGEITGYNAFAIDTEEWSGLRIEDVKDDNYDAYKVLKDMKAGDKVAVIPYTEDDGATWEVGEAYAPETVSGTLTRVDIYNSEAKRDGNAIAITVGGTSYKINEWNEGMIDIKSNDIKATRKDVTLLLAKDGTALQVKDVGNSGEWMIVGDYYQGTNDAGKVVWYVHGWTTSGTEVDLDLGTIRGAAEKYAPGELVRCQINTASGGGEYVLTKPNNLGSSVKKAGMYNLSTPNDKDTDGEYTHPWEYGVSAKAGTFFGEPARANGSDTAKNWEGIYRVALGYGTDAATGTAKDYDIDKSSQYILLDGYGRGHGVGSSAVPALASYNAGQTSAPERRFVKAGDTVESVVYGYTWDFQDVDYDSGVKFIYVSFDSQGEVESLYIANGKQDVDNREMRAYNSWWRNVGTNNDDFVATAAEAYVNDKGNVAAVVIKTDSADADLSGIRIITKNTGSNNYVKSVGADATETELLKGKWTEREYVQGPDFKETKTGIFDKEYDVGDILIGSERNGIFYARGFHGDSYRGNSLDGLWIKGIGQVENTQKKVLEDRFSIVGSTLRTLDGDSQHTLTPSTNPAINDLLTRNSNDNADEIVDGRHQAGIILGGSAKVVDARVGHEGEITKLKDLIKGDFDLTQVELKVLLNGKAGDSGFRSAYVVVILDTKDPVKYAATPEFDVDVTSDGDGDWNEAETVYEVTKGEKVTLTADLTNRSKLTDVSYDWSAKVKGDGGKAVKVKASDNVAVFTASTEGTFEVTVKVTNKDNKNTDKTVPKTIEIQVGPKAVAGQGKVEFADTVKGGETITGRPTFRVSDDGTATILFTASAPKFASIADNDIATVAARILYDGDEIVADDVLTFSDSDFTFVPGDAGSANTEAKNGKITYKMGATDQAAVQAVLAGYVDEVESLTFEITELTYDNYGIKVVDEDAGKTYYPADLANAAGTANFEGTKGATNGGKVVVAGEALTVKYHSTATTGTLTAAVSGVDFTNNADASLTLSATAFTATTSKVTPTGDDYVTITVSGTGDLTEKIQVTAASAVLLNGTGMVIGDATEKVAFYLLNDDLTTATDADENGRAKAEIWAYAAEATMTNPAISVALKGPDGNQIGKVIIDTAGVAGAKKLGEITLTESWEIKDTDVTTAKAAKSEISTAVTADGATFAAGKVLKVTFNKDVKIATGKTLDDIYTISAGDGATLTFKPGTVKFENNVFTAEVASYTAGSAASKVVFNYIVTDDDFEVGIGASKTAVSIANTTQAISITNA